ncbi:AraC family transcriptional regulator [Pseudactinotalea terrae]|uniref:AraC family transcriptional regulator n=1 Tax=Pseudactinotalea terrae TaxID=1743262 RepID=UPI0012E1CFD6|nr:AraC family transcriptional regulator [Pseudactinotalea terrae]
MIVPAVHADAFAALLTAHPPELSGSHGAVTCEPGWSWRFSGSRDFDVWAVTAGHGEVVLDDEHAALSPGTVLLLRPGSSGAAEQDPADRLSVLYCHFRFGSASTPEQTSSLTAEQLAVPVRVSQLDRDHRAIAHLRALVDLTDEAGHLAHVHRSVLLQLVLMELWRAAPSSTDALDTRIARVMMAVRSEPGRRWSLAEAAALAHLSRPHFSRLFTSVEGRSFRTFCLDVRLGRAHQLLSESPMSVTEVARALGYPDVYLFSRQVRAHLGAAPSTIQRVSRNRANA